MKRPFFLLSFVLISLTLSAQNKVELYYQLTNKAELAICKDDFKLALDYYEKAFALDPEMTYTIDLGNAVTVCGKLNKWSTAKKYFIQLREKGLNEKGTKSRLEGSFPDKIAFWEKLKQVEPPHEFQLERAALRTLQKYDSQVRWDCPGYQEHCIDVIRYVDSITYSALMKLIETKGWLSNTLLFDGTPASSPIYHLIILHNGQWGRYWALDAMKKALYDGKIHPEVYSQLTDRFKESNKAAADELGIPNYAYALHYKFNGKYYLGIPQPKSIDEDRAKIYLEPIEDRYTKIKYQMQHEEFNFSYHSIVSAKLSEERIKMALKEKMMKPLELD